MTIVDEVQGERLDRLAALLLPDASLRARRRLIEQGLVLVDGRPRTASFKPHSGQVVEILAVPTTAEEPAPEDILIVQKTQEYAAVCKPAGLHSAALAGKPGPSLEALLPSLFLHDKPLLVNRLDRETSGLVLVALHPDAAKRYRDAEDQGLSVKRYVAKVHGRLEKPVRIDRAVDCENRRISRVLECRADPLRVTRVEPLRLEEGATLVQAVIHKGARHQIRAHLACVGHPIVGDALYGPGCGPGCGPDCRPDSSARLYLHCQELDMPEFVAECPCDWKD